MLPGSCTALRRCASFARNGSTIRQTCAMKEPAARYVQLRTPTPCHFGFYDSARAWLFEILQQHHQQGLGNDLLRTGTLAFDSGKYSPDNIPRRNIAISELASVYMSSEVDGMGAEMAITPPYIACSRTRRCSILR